MGMLLRDPAYLRNPSMSALDSETSSEESSLIKSAKDEKMYTEHSTIHSGQVNSFKYDIGKTGYRISTFWIRRWGNLMELSLQNLFTIIAFHVRQKPIRVFS